MARATARLLEDTAVVEHLRIGYPDRMESRFSEDRTSLANELARERSREAADRTLLAWIRTSLAMISLGFGIERLGQAVMAFDGRIEQFSTLETRAVGAALILIGVAATLAGLWEHKRVLADIARPEYRYAERPPIARYMGMVMVLVGMAAMGLILLRY